MKKYSTSKKKAMAMIVTILLIILCVILFLVFSKSNLSAVFFTVLIIIFPFVYTLFKFISDLNNTITLEDDGFKYKKKGQNERKVRWSDIESLQFSGITWLPLSHILVINIGAKCAVPDSQIYIDYMFHNYKELWKEIIIKYKVEFKTVIDPKLEKILSSKN